jgi:hypothetical protein
MYNKQIIMSSEFLISFLIINIIFIVIFIPCYLVYYIEFVSRNQYHNERIQYMVLRQVEEV